jgi:hypothetical protein
VAPLKSTLWDFFCGRNLPFSPLFDPPEADRLQRGNLQSLIVIEYGRYVDDIYGGI